MACCGVDSQWTSAAVFGKCAGTVSVRDDFDARAPRPVSTAGQPVTIPPHTFLGRLRSFTIGLGVTVAGGWTAVSYTHLRAHETDSYLVCRLLLEKKKKK